MTRETIARGATQARILLAEDNPVNQQVALAILRKRGHQVMAVPDGEKAVEAVRTHGFDLVFMDIQMPVMDGLEATRRIRAIKTAEELPIIALTAHAFADERERTRAVGMNDFLAKPFKPQDLYELVDRWVGRRRVLDGGAAPEGAAAVPAGPPPPVDLPGFRAMMREAGVEEMVDATVEIYLSEGPTIMEEIDRSVLAGDAHATRRAAHSLKSASGTLRAGRLVDLLQAMEALGRDGDTERAARALPELRAEFDSVMTYLRTSR